MRLSNDPTGISVSQLGIQTKAKLRELYGNIRLNSGLVDFAQYVEILRHFLISLGGTCHSFIQMIERRGTALGINLANESNCFIDGLTRYESRRKFLKNPKTCREVF
jgi:hypothetical protein